MIREGQGFVIQTAYDSPWAGWFSVRELDWVNQIKTNPSLFLRHLGELMTVLPGGVSVLWDCNESLHQSTPGLLTTLESMLLNLPGLCLHTKQPLHSDPIEAPLNVWHHSPTAPEGDLSVQWRKGIIGWIPQPYNGWSLPGIGHAPDIQEDCVGGIIWGEVTISAPSLFHLDIEGLRHAIEDAQAHIERAMSLRSSARAWPQHVPFQRRQTAWRLTLTGGREYQLSGQSWEKLSVALTAMKSFLSAQLKCKIHVGVSKDAMIAGILGEQAMRHGFPWRNTLSLPPAPPSFTPGIAADYRKTAPLEARASFPMSLAPILSDPPVALLRVPVVPSFEGVNIFLKNIEVSPAIRWLPPNMPPPGPFHFDIPWDSDSAFPPVFDTCTIQPGLFDMDD